MPDRAPQQASERFLIPDKSAQPMRVYHGYVRQASPVRNAQMRPFLAALQFNAQHAPHFNGAGQGRGKPDQGQLAQARNRN